VGRRGGGQTQHLTLFPFHYIYVHIPVPRRILVATEDPQLPGGTTVAAALELGGGPSNGGAFEKSTLLVKVGGSGTPSILPPTAKPTLDTKSCLCEEKYFSHVFGGDNSSTTVLPACSDSRSYQPPNKYDKIYICRATTLFLSYDLKHKVTEYQFVSV
jgi:hypothetical protein